MKTNEEFNNLMKLDKHILLNSLILPGMNEEIDAILFKNSNDFTTIFFDFCKYCNISINDSNIQGVI